MLLFQKHSHGGLLKSDLRCSLLLQLISWPHLPLNNYSLAEQEGYREAAAFGECPFRSPPALLGRHRQKKGRGAFSALPLQSCACVGGRGTEAEQWKCSFPFSVAWGENGRETSATLPLPPPAGKRGLKVEWYKHPFPFVARVPHHGGSYFHYYNSSSHLPPK